MRVETFDGAPGRRVLIGMVVNKTVLGRVASVWGEQPPFDAAWLNRVGGWCVRHYRQYGEAPGSALQAYYEEDAAKLSRDEASALDEFLEGLSGEYERHAEEINPDHLIDLAGRHFDDVKLRRLEEGIAADRSAGKLEQAKARVTKFTASGLGVQTGVDLFVDREAIRSTYSKEIREPLIVYPGDLGRFFGSQLGRDCFVGIMAIEKGGKSYFLLDMAYRAMCQRRRVAYFQVGDLSEAQIKDRFLVRAAKRPSLSSDPEGAWPCTVRWPMSIKVPIVENEPAQVEFEDRVFDCPIDAVADWDVAVKEAVRRRVKSKHSLFRLWCCPTRTATMSMIRAQLDAWEISGWGPPDVVVIDYADILAPEDRKEDKIQQVKTTWEEMRKLSQTLHCLLVTATQVNSDSYKKRRLDRTNFAGNHLKFAEVTAMYGLSTTVAEKETQVCRLNVIAQRQGDYSVGRDVHVAQCLALSNPAVCAVFPHYGGPRRAEGGHAAANGKGAAAKNGAGNGRPEKGRIHPARDRQ
jgi:hypothetical protein